MLNALTLLILAAGADAVAARAAVPPATLVIRNATIHTASAARPAAQAMAVAGARIVAVGDDASVQPFIGPATRVVDLNGQTVLPGLIDSHGHMLNLGNRLSDVDVVGTASYEAVISRVVERARITRETKDPPGGAILHDTAGEPTGVLVDAATGLVNGILPPISPAERERRLLDALRECARLGLTMVHDAGIGEAEWAAYQALLGRGTFPIRINAMARASDALAESLLAWGPRTGGRLSMRAIKVVADGALGSRGALLGTPYTDDPHHLGLATFPLERMRTLGERAFAKGLQVRVHAIGDSANHGTLDVFEQIFDGQPQVEARWAIEHAQIVRPADIPRFARLGVVASMQPTHATSDGPWAETRLGPERVRWGYAWRDFMKAGVRLVSGSDFPVESANPMLGLYAAITRRDPEGKLPAGGWFPEQRMTPTEALESFTAAGAWLAFREADLGTLEVGKQADFIVVDRDVIGGPPEEIPKAKVLWTVVGGRTAFELKGP